MVGRVIGFESMLVVVALCGPLACGGRSGSNGTRGTPAGGSSANAAGAHAALAGAGAGGTSFDENDAKALLAQAPHCDPAVFQLRIEGSIDAEPVEDIRTENVDAGYTNDTSGAFATPFDPSVPLEPGQVAVSLQWARGLSYGQASPTLSGVVVPPAGHPRAGQELCVSEGAVGFADQGAEEGVFKFSVRAAREGVDCAGESLPIELRGCMN